MAISAKWNDIKRFLKVDEAGVNDFLGKVAKKEIEATPEVKKMLETAQQLPRSIEDLKGKLQYALTDVAWINGVKYIGDTKINKTQRIQGLLKTAQTVPING